jgi:hypothetical protein
MKLEDKIRDRKIGYFFRKKPAIAFELALLHFILAKRRNARKKIADACLRSIYWMRKAGVAIPEYLEQLKCLSQLEEIEKLLVLNKTKLDACTA